MGMDTGAADVITATTTTAGIWTMAGGDRPGHESNRGTSIDCRRDHHRQRMDGSHTGTVGHHRRRGAADHQEALRHHR